jgi:uncharacterized protein (UPF0261 family)
MAVILLGTLDTKGAEYGFLADRIRAEGVEVVLIDAGVFGPAGGAAQADIGPDEVAAAAGTSRAELAAAGDRGAAVTAMARGAALIVARLHAEGRLDAIAGLGGSGGATLATQAMRELPVGVPKLMVTTVASGDTRPYVGARDITMMPSVVDIAGINRVSARILANAAAAVAGMARSRAPELTQERPLIAASMFGVTTAAVDAARARLDELGYEVLVFHQTGVGGESMEALVSDGFVDGMLDLTTTELADELVGGALPAHPRRLEVAGAAGVPQVVSLGALDMVNFGPMNTVPDQFKDRNLYVHNANITLMRTTPAECAQLGRRLADKLNSATGPTALFVPLRGISAIAVEGQPFHDPEADEALFGAVRDGIGSNVELIELDTHINDPEFARAAADKLHEFRS